MRPRSASGFTLLELMITVAIIGVFTLTAHVLRGRASNEIFRATHRLRALELARDELARRALEPLREGQVIEASDFFAGDTLYRYELRIERFDLSSGRPEGDEDDDLAEQRRFEEEQMSRFADAGTNDPDGGTDDPYLVRYYHITAFLPSLEDDGEEELVLEGFWPLVRPPEDEIGLQSRFETTR